MSGNFFIKDINGSKVNPYQKPLALYLRLLKCFALPGSTIIDVTTGSGSLEVAAMEPTAPKDLVFISFEKNKYQASNAVTRFDNVCEIAVDKNNVPVDVEAERMHHEKK